MNRRLPIVTLVAALALGTLMAGAIGCGPGSDEPVGGEAVEIASVLPLTGVASELGQEMRRGQELAVERFNAQPGSRRGVRVTFEDSRSSPVEGTRAVQSLLARGFRFFVVPLSTVGMAARPMLESAGALAFLDASHPDLTRPAHPLVFRHSQTAEAEARLIAPAAVDRQGPHALFVFYLDDEYGRTFLDEFRTMVGPGVPIDAHGYDAATTDLRTVVQASGLTATEGAVAIAVGAGRPLGLLIRAMREDGYQGIVFASIGYIATGARAVLGADRGNIVYTDLSWADLEATDWLSAEYRRRFDRDLTAAAVIEFQTVLMIATSGAGADTTTPESVAAGVAAAAQTVVGVAPTPANDILPAVLLKAEPDGRPF